MKNKPLTGQNIVCVASADWNNPCWVTVHHIMSRLAQSNRVLFIETLGLRPPALSRADLGKLSSRFRNLFRGPRTVRRGILVVSPFVLPWHGSPIVKRLNRWLLSRSIRRLQRRFGFDRPILWVFLPTGSLLAGRLDERLLIYHCVDDYGANPKVSRADIEEHERSLLDRADLVFTTSQHLYEQKKTLHGRVHYSPNVADAEHFASALDPTTPVPGELAAIARPRIGFVGNLSSYKVDFSLLVHLAESRPDLSLVLIGPIGVGDPDTKVGRLFRYSNVKYLGCKDYREIPAYLKGIDVCLIPFNVNESTDGSYPLKLFEYMAAGKPIVATNLKAFEEGIDPDLCAVSENPFEFVDNVERSLKENSPERIRRRVETAQKNTWDGCVDQISNIIVSRLEERP